MGNVLKKALFFCCIGAAVGMLEAAGAIIFFEVRYAFLDKYVVFVAVNGLLWSAAAACAGGAASVLSRFKPVQEFVGYLPPAGAWLLILPGGVLFFSWIHRLLPKPALSVLGITVSAILALGVAALAFACGLAIKRYRRLRRVVNLCAVVLTVAAYAAIGVAWFYPTIIDRSDANPRPSVALLVIDSLRTDQLGCYGGDANWTPNVDRLASRGVLFRNCVTPAPWTLPATASIFTGEDPRQHGVTFVGRAVPASLETLPEAFSRAGYRTAVFSANHLVSARFGFGRGCDVCDCDFDSAFLPAATLWGRGYRVLFGTGQAKRRAADLQFWARRWLRKSDGRPFFLYIHYMEPHYPYVPSSYRSTFPVRRPPVFQPDLSALMEKAIIGAPVSLPAARRADLYRRYVAEVAELDAQLGNFTTFLERKCGGGGLILVLTADHGEEFGEHGNYYHGLSLYDEVCRVPFLIMGSSEARAGTVVNAQCGLADVYPTLLDLCGVRQLDSNPALGGKSLTALLNGTHTRGRPVLLHDLFGSGCRRCELTGVRTDAYKFYEKRIYVGDRRAGGAVYYFDLVSDPGEGVNMASKGAEAAARVSEARGYYERLRLSLPEPAPPVTIGVGDARTRDKLRALGYIK